MSLEQLIQKATTDTKFAEALRHDEGFNQYFAKTELDLRRMRARLGGGSAQTNGFCGKSSSPFK